MLWLFGAVVLATVIVAIAEGRLKAGVAVIEPRVIAELDRKPFWVSKITFLIEEPRRIDNLSKGSLRPIEKTLEGDIESLPARSLDRIARMTFGHGSGAHLKMSAGLVNDRRSSLILTGVVT
ncbi:hypothetical protein ACFQ12_02480 [Methylobacterium trifolii]